MLLPEASPALVQEAGSSSAVAPVAARTLRVPRAKTRLHPLNPLSAALLQPPPHVDWAAAFSDASLPLCVDVGCGYGELVLMQSEANAGTNYLPRHRPA